MTDKIKADVSAMRETTKSARRDTGFVREIAILNPATGSPIVTARIYQPGTVARCSVWISSRGNGTYGRGQGEAGGGGYHKASAALEAALRDAGVQISRAISGVGDQAMRDALEAVAHAVAGRGRVIIHEAHA